MKCPRCQRDLKESDFGQYGFVIVDVCQQCQGAWFDKGELDRIDDSVWTNVEEIDLNKAAPIHHNIKCPKCHANLVPVSPKDAEELIVDRCTSCQGFWLDKGELDQLREVTIKLDSDRAKEMIPLHRPSDWSYLRWSIYCFKECYFGHKG